MDSQKTHGAPSWIEFAGPDTKAARSFYESVLDWAVNEMPMADGGNYPAILVGEQPVGGFSPNPAPQAGWMVYITVDDVDARFEKAKAAGATAITEPFDAPGVGRMCHIVDPMGAPIAFIKYAA